uniref:Bifunctional oligoribonuclease/PAP phosphatase NrnA n=1 Tax=Roseihalotalea indica TaxID=2867963 RepID=A0AA49JG69_9BACT|nr:bifunctional oligoribonuclease/PAP phosphatase NrnA [Tunicatimonas sp. TK19036]
MQDTNAFKELLRSPQKVVIIPHQNPDADALGSALGLALYLKKQQHQVQVISPTDYPEFLHWMKDNEHVLAYSEKKHQDKASQQIAEADVIICVDFCSLNRIDALEEPVRQAKATKVLIDHHYGKGNFADIEFWNTSAAATCELLYQLIIDLGGREFIDKDMAECLYAGIMTDTGSFRHPNTTQHVHEVVADLIALGADVSKVSKLVYDNNSVDRLRFIGYALNQKLVVMEEYKTAYFAITAEDLRKFKSRTGDTEGLVNYALSIKGINMAAIIIDRTDVVKLSFRSVGDFAVNDLAAKHFEGGGHKNAAGGVSRVSLEETLQKFLKLLPEYKEKLYYNHLQQKALHVTS